MTSFTSYISALPKLTSIYIYQKGRFEAGFGLRSNIFLLNSEQYLNRYGYEIPIILMAEGEKQIKKLGGQL